MRRVAIISPYFPPSTLAGVHRARLLAKHLPAAGWEPVIICADPADYEERPDPDLATLVPAEAKVIRVRAASAALSRRFGVGDLGIRAYGALNRAVTELAARREADLVMITGSPFYPMLMARTLKRRFGLPVVLDFQDPWVSDWGRVQLPLSKPGLSHRLAVYLEPLALRAASWVTSVSETQNAAMAGDYPWFDPSRMTAIPIGGDPEDYSALARMGRARSPVLKQGVVNLSYVGTFLPRGGPVLRSIFRAFSILKTANPAVAARIRFNFIGTSNQPNDTASFRVMAVAREEGVADAVNEVPQRLPYLDALAILSQSDALLLLGSDEPHYTASKIYPGLMSATPYVSVFHAASSAHAILSRAGGGLSFGFTDAASLGALDGSIAAALEALADGRPRIPPANWSLVEPYTAPAIARRFSEVFDAAIARRPVRG